MTILSYDAQGESLLRAYGFFFKALANETRLAIIEELLNGDLSVSELVDRLGMEQSRVSHNLRCLAYCGFVFSRREGKKVIYTLNRETVLPLLKIAERHVRVYASHLLTCEVLRR